MTAPDHEQATRLAQLWASYYNDEFVVRLNTAKAGSLARAYLDLAAQLDNETTKRKLAEQAYRSLDKSYNDTTKDLAAQLAEAQEEIADLKENDHEKATLIGRQARQLAERERVIEAAHIELGRHLCYTGEWAQRSFWKQVQDRAATNSDSEASDGNLAVVPVYDEGIIWHVMRDGHHVATYDDDNGKPGKRIWMADSEASE